MFRTVTSNANKIGMAVNATKTQLLAIAPAQRKKFHTFLNPSDSEPTKTIESGQELKILGFYFGERPTAAVHVHHLKREYHRKI